MSRSDEASQVKKGPPPAFKPGEPVAIYSSQAHESPRRGTFLGVIDGWLAVETEELGRELISPHSVVKIVALEG